METTAAKIEEASRTLRVVLFRTLREHPRRVLDYYVVDGEDDYACFASLCEDTGMEKCRYMLASAEAILATISEPPRTMDFNKAVDALNVELHRAAQDDGGHRVLFGYLRKLACTPGATIH